MEGAFSLDRKALARAFDRAAPHYDSSLPSLQRLNTELLERLRYFALEPECILDLGAGTCHAALALRQQFPRAQVIALDLSLAMLCQAPRSWLPRARFHRVAGEAGRLPLRDHSVDLAYSNLLLPFCDQPPLVFGELARVLKPGALFLFATLGPETLKELRLAWEGVDGREHVGRFLGLPQLGEALMQSGLTEPVMDADQYQLEYPNARALMRVLKGLGAQNASISRPRGLTGRRRFQGVIEAYEQARTNLGIPATFEIIFGAAFGGGKSPGRGEYAVPIASVSRRQR
jgi:malonyl-CoA O-methyltransferase